MMLEKNEGLLAERFDDLLLKLASAPGTAAFLPISRSREIPGWSPEMRRRLAEIARSGPDPNSPFACVMNRLRDLGRPVSLRTTRRDGQVGVEVHLPGSRAA